MARYFITTGKLLDINKVNYYLLQIYLVLHNKKTIASLAINIELFISNRKTLYIC